MIIYTVHEPQQSGETVESARRQHRLREGRFHPLGIPFRAVLAPVNELWLRVCHRACLGWRLGPGFSKRGSATAGGRHRRIFCSRSSSASRATTSFAGGLHARATPSSHPSRGRPTRSASGAFSTPGFRFCAAARPERFRRGFEEPEIGACLTRSAPGRKRWSEPMSVVIVDYQSGNLHSAAKAFERAARESGSSAEIAVSSDPEAVRSADRIVLPGVGAFGDCYRGLERNAGHDRGSEGSRVLDAAVRFLASASACKCLRTADWSMACTRASAGLAARWT